MKIVVQGFGVVGAATALNIVSSKNFKNNYKVHCIEKKNLAGVNKIENARMGKFPIETTDKSMSIALKKAL